MKPCPPNRLVEPKEASNYMKKKQHNFNTKHLPKNIKCEYLSDGLYIGKAHTKHFHVFQFTPDYIHVVRKATGVQSKFHINQYINALENKNAIFTDKEREELLSVQTIILRY